MVTWKHEYHFSIYICHREDLWEGEWGVGGFPYCFYSQVKALNRLFTPGHEGAAAAEASTVDTSLSGPEEADIFPAWVFFCHSGRFFFFTHITYDGGLAKRSYTPPPQQQQVSERRYLRSLGLWEVVPHAKPQESLVSQIYTVTSLNIIHSLELEQ